MELRVTSIKKAKKDLINLNLHNIKAIIISSYDDDIEIIPKENKLLLNFHDINYQNQNSFNIELAQQIKVFVNNIDFQKYKIYICCDSGESRSSAIAACLLRKFKEDEDVIWKDSNYHPNILVYSILCDEFGLKNSKLRLKYKMYINEKALKNMIKKAKNSN